MIRSGHVQRIAAGEQLPVFTAGCLDGSHLTIRRFYLRANLLLFFMHEWPCVECSTYLETIDRSAPAFSAERCQPVAVVPLGQTLLVAWPRGAPRHVPVAFAEGQEIHARYGLVDQHSRAQAALVLADETGTVQQVWQSDEHRFPEAQELLEWARFLSYRCSECSELPWWPEAADTSAE